MNQKLKSILKYAYDNSEFYRNLYNSVGIYDISNIKSIKQLPIVTEKDILTYPNLIRASSNIYKITASSGTKGNPKVMYRTLEDFENSVKNEVQLMKWARVSKTDRIAIFHSYGLWGYGEITQEAAKRLDISVLPIGDIGNSVAIPLLKMFLPTVLDITPSRLLQIMDDIRKDKKIIENLRIIMCAGEYLSSSMKRNIETNLGVKVFNQYGSEETDGLAGSLDDSGVLHSFPESFFYEIHNEKNGIGELLITSYYHHGTPLIRYNLRDYVKFISKDKFIILGRSCESYELFDGVILYPYQIENILEKYVNFIKSWKVIISGNSPVKVEIYINFVSKNCFDNERLIEDLCNASIDIKLLVDSGDLIFFIKENNEYESITARGKSRKFIDLRKRD